MSERGGTNILFIAGIGLIITGAALYGILALFGVSFAVGEATAQMGPSALIVFAVPGLVFIGLILLFVKVAADRFGSKEDDHYSRTVDK